VDASPVQRRSLTYKVLAAISPSPTTHIPYCPRRPLPRLPRLSKRHQPSLRLIPQRQPHAAQAVGQRQPADVAQFRVVAQHAVQAVIGHPGAEVMHMVDADIGGEPAQQGRQVVMRTAEQGGLLRVPLAVLGP